MKCKKSEKGTTGIQHHFAVNNDRPPCPEGQYTITTRQGLHIISTSTISLGNIHSNYLELFRQLPT